jgi:hypothetical protein
MSKKHRHRPFQRVDLNDATTAQPTAQKETIMAPTQQEVMDQSAAKEEAPQGPTAKQMALAEEQNLARKLKLLQQQNEPPPPKPALLEEALAQGYEGLEAQMKRQAEAAKPREYVPPPRTARQMSALEEELEAGRKTQQRAQAQLEEAQRLRAAHAAAEAAKEGFTTPVYRPNDLVPDPITGKLGTYRADT